ncbi:MAG TPA: RHS repeat protein [bacterium]|nr:RHS repeat protein [bacterium]
MIYDQLGNLIEKNLPNGIKEQYNYDDMGRLICKIYFKKG